MGLIEWHSSRNVCHILLIIKKVASKFLPIIVFYQKWNKTVSLFLIIKRRKIKDGEFKLRKCELLFSRSWMRTFEKKTKVGIWLNIQKLVQLNRFGHGFWLRFKSSKNWKNHTSTILRFKSIKIHPSETRSNGLILSFGWKSWGKTRMKNTCFGWSNFFIAPSFPLDPSSFVRRLRYQSCYCFHYMVMGCSGQRVSHSFGKTSSFLK